MKIQLNPLAPLPANRLSPETRELAANYLSGGQRTRLRRAPIHVSQLGLPADCPDMTRRAHWAVKLAECADLCILPQERLAGAAPFLEALEHHVPGMEFPSISHTTVDFGNAVRLGLTGLENEIRTRRETAETQDQKIFADALLELLSAIRLWIKRYISAYRDLLNSGTYPQYEQSMRQIVENLEKCPENPPETFSQAIQSFWIFFEFERLCGNWSGLGRFDKILGGLLRKDLEHGIITLEEARELVAHFWIKGTEWCHGPVEASPFRPGSGDAQSYQNILLGGIDADGNPVENELTYLVLDVVEELHISDYPVSVRLNRNTPERLLRKIAAVQLLGGGIVAVYNEEVVIDALVKFGYPLEEAREFTNDGCWEMIIPGKTAFGYCPFDAMKCLQDALFAEPAFENSETLYRAFLKNLRNTIEHIRETALRLYYSRVDKDAEVNATYIRGSGSDIVYNILTGSDVVLSLLMPSCRESLRSYQAWGAKYQVRAIHAGGLPDVANTLIAVKALTEGKKKITPAELIAILRNDWKDAEDLRRFAADSVTYYGNDDADADSVMKRVFDDYTEIVAEHKLFNNVRMPAGISTFGREIEYADYRMATAFGKHAHEYLASNLSPTPGTDKKPLTAVLNSYCRMDFTRTPNGCPLDLRLSAGLRRLPNAEEALAKILKVFVLKKGLYLQIDAVDPEILKQARENPDRFPNLVVRISGWSTRFATLERKWQDMIINRSEQDTL